MGIPLEVWNPRADRSQFYRWSGARLDSWPAAHRYWLDLVALALQEWSAQQGIRLPADPEAALARLENWSLQQLAGLALPVKPVELLRWQDSGAPVPTVVQPPDQPPPVRTSLEAWLQLAWQPVDLELDHALAGHTLLRTWEARRQLWEDALVGRMADYLGQVRQQGQQGMLPGALGHWPNPRTRGMYLLDVAYRQARERGVCLPPPPPELVAWEPLVRQVRGELWLAYLPLALRAVLARVRGQLDGEAVLDLLIEMVEVLGDALSSYNEGFGYTPAFFLEAQVLPTALERAIGRQVRPWLSRHRQEALRRLQAARVAAADQGLPATVAQWAQMAGLGVEEAVQLLAADQPPLSLSNILEAAEPLQPDPREDWGLVTEVLATLPADQRSLLVETALVGSDSGTSEALCQAQAQFVALLRLQAPAWVARLEGDQ